ncbi:MAG: nucleotidyltransferase family protein [Nitrososphaerota archaeon]|nr:nucleotidyltransferase family protein [Nitrososphaerota archaeon]
MKAVILAGGLGTRLRPYTFFAPKPMLPLGDRPLLEHILLGLKDHGFTDAVITVSYLRRAIEDYFRDGSDLGMKIEYVRSDGPMGTGGQLKTVEGRVDDRFLLVYADMYVEADFRKLVEFHESKKGLATVLVMPYRETLKYGFLDSDDQGRLVDWREKPEFKGWINVGCYVMEKRFLDYIPAGKMFGMDEAFRLAMKAGEPIYLHRSEGDFVDIGDKKSYMAAYNKYLQKLGRIL